MTEVRKDRSVTGEILSRPSPSEDFYRYVNHEWLQKNSIPPSESRWGSFDILAHETYERLREIAENAMENQHEAEKGSNVQLVGDFYSSGMDMETRNKLGLAPLSELRSSIESITDAKDAIRIVAGLRQKGISTFCGMGFDEDNKKAGNNAFYIYQGGIGLPDRDYYLKDEKSMQEVRGKYKEHISALFQMSGRTKEEADNAAEAVYNIEYALAEASLPEEEAREVDKNYFKYTVEEAGQEFPGIDWGTYFEALGKPDIKDFVVMQPKFVKKVGEILQNTDVSNIKAYLEFTLLNTKAGALSEDFVSENFKFNGQILLGLKEPKPLWKKTIQALHSTPLTEAIGPLYCEKYFNPRDKVEIREMVEDVREAFRERVRYLDWMDPQTKGLTWEKLDNITFKMGFPDQWLDVSLIDIKRDSFANNIMNLSEFNFRRKLDRLDEPYDRSEWQMPPTLVNACADLKREMTFPAAILQYPFYESSRDKAYNYGAIAMVVAHELTHFFDDQGCKFDVLGNINDLWSDQDRANFQERTQKFVKYFGRLVANGLRVNGQLTLGENIADVAGIIIAYGALQRRISREKDGVALVDGLTPAQRFFIGYGHIWAEKVTPERAKASIITDPHSPAEVRINGVLAINPQFHKAFGVGPGDAMYIPPKARPRLW